MAEKQHFIYMTTNLKNGKRYIGKHYGYVDDDYLGSGLLLHRAISLYGRECFIREILCFSKDGDENNVNEKLYIKEYDAVNSEDFYNIAEGGDGGDIFHSLPIDQQEKLRKRVSEAYSGEGNPMYGKHHSPETIEKLKAIDKSYTQTEEYRKNMAIAVSGEKNGMYGRHHTEESKQKMSEHHKGLCVGEKNGMYGKKGNDAINGKHVGMYDKDGNLIQVWASKKAVLDFLGLKGHTQLDAAIKSGEQYKGYYWKKEAKV